MEKDLFNLSKQEQIEILEQFKKEHPDRKLPVWNHNPITFLFMSEIDLMISHIKKGNATFLPCKDGSWGVKINPQIFQNP